MRAKAQDIRETLKDMIMEYIASSEEVGYCNECPELRYIEDAGCYDCPYGLDCTSCEYDCSADIDTVVDSILRVLEANRP